ncbi:hypothetical protein LI82_10930 [Methanococcoides methylutens]|uniref:Queuine tRNA-ribosyltransferase n=1 Tax=Methanococcoides methylutens TaxID=2226 RepID=A0A099SZA1_METMT|nr:hypothetical protein [Methanococcoides methylutens]KGK98225.1 hypothetical protein LI82_10930 [Methanococcoides methylutens]
MLARKLEIKYNDIGIITTPILLPSLSSRLNLDISNTIRLLSEVVTGPFLISSYDTHYCKNFPKIEFPNLIFLDSGGYECTVDNDVSEMGLYKPEACSWDEQTHLESITNWESEIPTVIISYDHPSKRENLESQIENAKKLFQLKDHFLKELLIKPESSNENTVNINNVIEKLDLLNEFDIIGFTEKELGTSVLKRMENIANLRKKMDEKDIQIPIHIFGSLDPITTPLYYFSGADIFDGLSWLRFTYEEQSGNAVYRNCIGPKKNGIHANMNFIWLSSIYSNYNYLGRLEINLKKFNDSHDFSIFGENKEFFKKSCDDLSEAIGGF